jgi:hypothetical protein
MISIHQLKKGLTYLFPIFLEAVGIATASSMSVTATVSRTGESLRAAAFR